MSNRIRYYSREEIKKWSRLATAVLFAAIISVAVATLACTANKQARLYGGTEKIELEEGRVLVNITWKGDAHLWILTRPRIMGDPPPQTYMFNEKSSWGVLQGTVIVQER